MAISMLDLALKHQKYDEIWQGTPVLLMVVYFYWETQTSRWVYLILMFGCFKNFQMPFPKKIWQHFGEKVSLSDDIKIAM